MAIEHARSAILTVIVGAALTALLPRHTRAADHEQFFPVLVHRTGAYAPNGAPFANGYVDYLKLVNARDGGIGGVKATYEECETGFATDRGIECYERLKGRGPTGATAFHPMSTGLTAAVTDRSAVDRIPIITPGYGRSESIDGAMFRYNFPLGGMYWTAADVLVQHVGAKEGGLGSLKGKRIALVYHDSPFGKEPIALMQQRARLHEFDLQLLPVTHPGLEQKATWLTVRQLRPDYVFLWGWGAMNSTAIKEAVATGYPRERIYGVWWAGAEQDTRPAGEGAKGYNALSFQTSSGRGQVHRDIVRYVHDRGDGTGQKDEIGEVLYNRGMVAAMLSVEGVRRAQVKYGRKPLTGEQVRWGLENLAIDDAAIAALGLSGFMTPVVTSCSDHMGGNQVWIQTWDGMRWQKSSDIYAADMQVIAPMVRSAVQRYGEDKKLKAWDCAKESSN